MAIFHVKYAIKPPNLVVFRVPGLSDEIKKDLSNITERSEEASPSTPSSKEAVIKALDDTLANEKTENLTVGHGTDRALKCLRCKSPIGLTVD